jgi:hypothetical protein
MAYASGTINALNSKRSNLPFQDAIGTTNDVAAAVRLLNGTIGGGFNAADSKENFTPGTLGWTDAGKGATYAKSAVIIPPGATAAVLTGGGWSAATGGTYTIPYGAKANEYVWGFIT